MYPENPEGTQVIVGSMNMGYIELTTCSGRPKREPLGHSDEHIPVFKITHVGKVSPMVNSLQTFMHANLCKIIVTIIYFKK